MRKPTKEQTALRRERPSEGGSYIRGPDGTLTPEAKPEPEAAVPPATGDDEK